MDSSKSVSLAVIRRLPRYYRYLGDLLDNGITRISSKDLSKKMSITASQIRQDLNNFGCFGQQGFGYSVEKLYNEIKKILGLDKIYSLVIIGSGNIGQALVNYLGFERRGFHFAALFDMNPKVVGLTIRGIEVRDVDTLEDYLTNNQIDIAVLALPKANATAIAEIVMKCGVKGIWNFSHIDLEVKNGVKFENVHLTDSLMTLSYKLNEDDIIERFNVLPKKG